MNQPTGEQRALGCLLGGAVGDALGAPVEFWSLARIRSRCGVAGVREYLPAYGRLGAITDDTQMTLFTAEGLIRADNRTRRAGGAGIKLACVHQAYLRWLETQGGRPRYPSAEVRGSYLLGQPGLNSARAPGNTCLSALRSGVAGAVTTPINDSKGCGGVMRVAPAGITRHSPETAFRLGADLAAITHGHPSGFLSAGFLAAMIAAIITGASLADAVAHARAELTRRPNHAECLSAVDHALALAASAPVASATVEQLGGGWTGEEAIAIALFCSLTATSFEDAVSLAVSHSGDSDSTGAITGNILGALWGVDTIPLRWLDSLELRALIEEVALDLWTHATTDGTIDDWQKYPG